MNTILYSTAQSFVIVLSFFLAIRCLFVHRYRLEAWRYKVKGLLYFTHTGFKRLIFLSGWIFYLIFLVTTYHQIMNFLD